MYVLRRNAAAEPHAAARDRVPSHPVRSHPGQPATGSAPAAARQSKTKRDLEMAGGRRVTVNLRVEAITALSAVRALGPHKTDTDAIHASLRAEAARLRRRTMRAKK